jgi:hypothetical protein
MGWLSAARSSTTLYVLTREVSVLPLAIRRPGHSPLPFILVTAMLSALLVFAATAVSVPTDALASVTKAAACSANLRTSPYISARLKTTIKTDTRVTIATTVNGGSWRIACAGKTLSGRYWHRISAINGKSVRSLYGVTYLYAASGLFKPVAQTITKYAACPASLRTSAATAATPKARVTTDTKVAVVTSVTGGSWSTFCAGRAVAGKYWYRISAINGRSVRSLYGVSYLYAASGLFKPTTIAAPTPLPIPVPTPPATSTPAPTGTRPFAAPLTTRTVTVPSTIDASGATDASTALNAFIRTVADGSVISFPAGGVYRLDHGIVLWTRHNLVFDGNGATLRLKGSGSAITDSAFTLWDGNSHITIREFTVIGNNPNTTTVYNYGGGESQMAVGIWGSSYIEVANVTASHTWGDFSQVNGHDGPSDQVWFHDNTGTYLGRNAISPINATHLLVEGNRFDRIGMHVFDIEPDYSSDLNAYITFRNNTIGIYGLTTAISIFSTPLTGYFFIAGGAPGSITHDVTVTGNTVVGNPRSGDGTPRGLNTRVMLARRANIVVTNNSSSQAAIGPVLAFAHVDGLVVSGNTQPRVSGSLLLISDCTGVSIGSNP